MAANIVGAVADRCSSSGINIQKSGYYPIIKDWICARPTPMPKLPTQQNLSFMFSKPRCPLYPIVTLTQKQRNPAHNPLTVVQSLNINSLLRCHHYPAACNALAAICIPTLTYCYRSAAQYRNYGVIQRQPNRRLLIWCYHNWKLPDSLSK